MDKPLSTWYCDVCGGRIADVEEGYVLWHSADGCAKDFKIIHRVKCDVADYESSMPLTSFVGADGLAWALSILSPGPIILRRSESEGYDMPDPHQLTDFIRRVQMPYYEEARRHFSKRRVRDAYHDANEVAPYRVLDLKRIIEMGRSAE